MSSWSNRWRRSCAAGDRKARIVSGRVESVQCLFDFERDDPLLQMLGIDEFNKVIFGEICLLGKFMLETLGYYCVQEGNFANHKSNAP
jgi:hypothetical protein